MTGSLKGHVALVTGAARGMGRSHAMLLAERGAQVVVCDLASEVDDTGARVLVADQVVAEITDAGGSAVADTSDIASFAGAAAAVQTGVDAFGKVDIIVNNAGGSGGGALIEDVTEEILDRTLALYYYAHVGAAKAAWPMMKAQRWGRVINIVSEEAFPREDKGDFRPSVGIRRGPRGGVGLVYGPARAAAWSATLGLASQGLDHGITVNAISPAAATHGTGGVGRWNPDKGIMETTSTSLDLDPIHVARVVAWLASDEASEVTAKVIHVGGVHRREYIMARHADTELVQQINEALDNVSASDL